ncbi:MAG: DUF2156 domain-containing protein [Myxococcota bacterium]
MASSTTLTAAPPALPVPVVQGDWLRQWLAWPARFVDGWSRANELPDISLAVRHRRLLSGAGPEGWLALQPGLATVGDETTWTSFAARGATALAVGGVHGPDRPAAFAQFREATNALGIRRQAVYPVREPDLDAARSAGFETMPVGVEAWVDLDEFTLEGKRFADLRQMRNRARNRGVVVQEVDPRAWAERLKATWRAFLRARDVPWQLRWLTGGPVFSTYFGHRTFVAHHDGLVQAFCTVLPGPDGAASLDVMCRHPKAGPGSMEALLVSAMEQLRTEGVQRVSLGPCPLAEGTAHEVPGVLGLAMRWAWEGPVADRWFGFRSLTAFKAKFCPRYERVHLGIAPGLSAMSTYLVARIWALGE